MSESPRPTLRPLLMRVHFYAGVLVGPFLLLAAVSGLLYAVGPQVEQVLYRDQLHTDVRGPNLPLEQQVAQARTVEPRAPLYAVRPAPASGQTTRVLFDPPGLGESEHLAVFVDPVSGEVRGRLVSYGSSGALPYRAWVDGLHRNLHLGEVGRVYSELAASWLWVIAVAGLLMWWTGPRRRRRRSGSARRRTLSWHAAVGTWVALGLLMLSATGLTWSRFAGAHVTDLRAYLGWATPTVSGGAGDHEGHDMAGMHHQMPADVVGVGPDAAARAATRLGIAAPYEVRPDGDRYVVAEVGTSWPARADTVAVDADSGRVTEVVRFADWPFPAKLARWGIQLHMGQLFGPLNQLALVALAGAIVVLVVLGYRMWWLRRPTRGHRLRLGRPAARGAWRRAPRPAVVALAVATAAVGWFLPVLGVSLLAFLAVDVAVGLRAGRGRRSAVDVHALPEHPALLPGPDDTEHRPPTVPAGMDVHHGVGVVAHGHPHGGTVVTPGRVGVRDPADVERPGRRLRRTPTNPGDHEGDGDTGKNPENPPHDNPSSTNRKTPSHHNGA